MPKTRREETFRVVGLVFFGLAWVTAFGAAFSPQNGMEPGEEAAMAWTFAVAVVFGAIGLACVLASRALYRRRRSSLMG
ncbi:MAG TPA: hypothetical protein VE760_08560 [Acidimicrobiales bacterium]|nr:hypothetical protein [Acidimicrobiales bacterium]